MSCISFKLCGKFGTCARIFPCSRITQFLPFLPMRPWKDRQDFCASKGTWSPGWQPNIQCRGGYVCHIWAGNPGIIFCSSFLKNCHTCGNQWPRPDSGLSFFYSICGTWGSTYIELKWVQLLSHKNQCISLLCSKHIKALH